jgi:hypothetical protein
MSRRLAPVLAITLAAGFVAACVTSAPSPRTEIPVASGAVPGVSSSVSPGLVPSPSATPDLDVAPPTSPPEEGNVEDWPMGPVLSIESVGKRSIQVALDDLDAKAWRLIVAGTGDLADDRLEITVETGDVAPLISVAEIRNGRIVGRMDLSEFGDPTAAAGGCHATLGACIDSDAIRLPVDGDGHLGLELTRTGATSLTVTGETAGWPGEPFNLGPWTATDAFPWEPGVAF